MRRAHIAVAVVVLIALSPAGVAVAQSLTHSATADTTYQTNSGVTVTLGDGRDVAAVPFADDQTFADGSLRLSGSDASVQAGDAAFSGDPVTVRDVDVTGELTVERTDLDRSVTVESGDANVLQVRDINVSDDTDDLAYNSDNGLTVTVTGQDPIGIAAVDTGTGEALDTANVDGDGVATFELPAGQRSVRLEPTPSELQVRNEADPSELIDGNVTLRARLFTGGSEVIERPVTDGTVSLDGVPPDQPVIVTVREENADFTYRRILLESVVQTSEIYLLPTNEPSAEIRFQLRDDTNRFDGADTRFFVEKPITRDFDGDGTNETRYQTISGDRIGADGEFPTILVDSERYRLRVENDAGEQRVLGSYTVQGARVSTIPIGSVEFSADIEEGAALQTNLREAPDGASHNYEVRIVYADPEGQTDEIDVTITNESGATIRPDTTESIDGATNYVETYPIEDTSFDPETDTATVTVTARGQFGEETFEQSLGDVPDVPIGPLNPQLAELMGLVSIIGVAGLLVIKSPPLAAFVSPGYAGLLTLVGIIDIPMAGVVLAGLIGVLAVVGSRGV
jgi:hypothetical protein